MVTPAEPGLRRRRRNAHRGDLHHGLHELGDRAALDAQRRSVDLCRQCDLANTVLHEVPADRGEGEDLTPGASRLVVWLIGQSGIMDRPAADRRQGPAVRRG
jgi:hypothetical protein